MACSTISKRIVLHKSILITSLFISTFFLSAGKTELGFEIVDDHKGFSFSLLGATNYVETKININPYKPFPHNISLQVDPVHKLSNTELDDALSTTLATALQATSKVLILIAEKEIKRRAENQKIDLYLQRCDKAVEKSNPVFEKIERQLSHG